MYSVEQKAKDRDKVGKKMMQMQQTENAATKGAIVWTSSELKLWTKVWTTESFILKVQYIYGALLKIFGISQSSCKTLDNAINQTGNWNKRRLVHHQTTV
jgi:hypothetical protein